MELTDLLQGAVRDAAANYPRSLQAEIGPSQVGLECTQRLARTLLDWPKSAAAGDPLPSFVGTAAHAATQAALERVNEQAPGTWLLEERVHVASGLSGSCDAYHVPSDTVLDHKFVGPSSLKTYRSKGPSRQYIVQIHCYGLGWENAGRTPKNVAIAFWPRGGAMKDLHVWTAPYDRQLALDALERVATVREALLTVDPEANPAMWAVFPKAPSHACTYCDWYRPASSDLSLGCPSEPGAVTRRAPIESLIA
ncbi:hypothetical protein [Allonocardiopsis opalescens]|uniref:hypothetical protein n=1 Tax=Allonocardiopsis opalescens TaxID=1144618 RepID=UPI0014739403|nr:hypothetical protein [Allonocardiopsis opalescens]